LPAKKQKCFFETGGFVLDTAYVFATLISETVTNALDQTAGLCFNC